MACALRNSCLVPPVRTVMPVVERRRRHEASQRPERPAYVRVNEGRLRRDEEHVDHQRCSREKPSTKIGTYVRPRVRITSTKCSRDPASQSISSTEW